MGWLMGRPSRYTFLMSCPNPLADIFTSLLAGSRPGLGRVVNIPLAFLNGRG